jgi:hypothetical protein
LLLLIPETIRQKGVTRKYDEKPTSKYPVGYPERAHSLRQCRLMLPVGWLVLLPIRNDLLRPRICIPFDVIVDHPIPFTPRRCLVHENYDTRRLRALSSACHLGELLHELLETMHLERGTHDDQQVGSFPHIRGLDLADLITQWMRFIVQYNGRPKCPDPQSTRGTCYPGLGCQLPLVNDTMNLICSGHSQRAVQSGQSGGSP